MTAAELNGAEDAGDNDDARDQAIGQNDAEHGPLVFVRVSPRLWRARRGAGIAQTGEIARFTPWAGRFQGIR